jgi:MYXO-CTERM domain-containing protein
MSRLRSVALAVAIVIVIGAGIASGVGGASAWAPITSSRPVWSGTVPYALTVHSDDLGAATTEAEVQRGMNDWTLVSCTDLRASYGGRSSATAGRGDGQSVIGWVESGWPHESGAIGVTGPRFSSFIVESDMQMNGVNYTWTTGSGRGSTVNAYSIILHEGGHYYGLGHSSSSSATMYFAYSGGVASLSSDDQAGICALYPGDGTDCTTTGCPTGQECVDRACVPVTGDGGICSPCTSGGDCAAGICLGYPDGSGYCGRSCSSSSECGGDQCVNITGVGGQCVRVSGGTPSCTATTPTGCTNDSECASSERCVDGDCEPRPMVGASIGEVCNGPSDCTSALCFRSECSQSCDWLEPGSCPAGFYCSGEATGSCGGSGICLRGTAGAAVNGASCSAATDCASLYCASGVCSEPCIPGGAAGCADGFACQVGAVAGCGSCQQSGQIGDPCEMNEDCTSRSCATIEGAAFCTDFCDAGDPCPERFSCLDTGVGVSVCAPDAGGLGAECETNDDCLSGICADERDRLYCTRTCDPASAPCPANFVCTATADPTVSVCSPSATMMRDRIGGDGCGCRAAGSGRSSGGAAALLAILGLGVVVIRRRS